MLHFCGVKRLFACFTAVWQINQGVGDGIPRTTADVLRDCFHDAVLNQVAAKLRRVACPQTKPLRHKLGEILLQRERNKGIALAVSVLESQLIWSHLRGVRRDEGVVLSRVAENVERHCKSPLTLSLLIFASRDKALRPVSQGAGMFSDAEQPFVELLRDGPKLCLLVANTVEGKPLDVRADVRSQMLGAFHQRPECIAEDSDVLGIDVLEG